MNRNWKKRCAVALVVVAFAVSAFGAGSASADDGTKVLSPVGGGGYTTNSVTWCRTC